ncbi:MAG: SAM-dependent methyltransferase [Gammaproteobacteria bacterium]
MSVTSKVTKARRIFTTTGQTYDDHLIEKCGYISPTVAANALADANDQRDIARSDIKVIDFGCGTGLVGAALAKRGFNTIDGADISKGMLEQARVKSVYRNLMQIDLTAGTGLVKQCYDAGLCIGSMGAGHVGSRHLPGMLRSIKPGGLFVIIINGMHYGPEGFDRAFAGFEDKGLWQIKRTESFNYMDNLDRPGWLVVGEVGG